MSDLRGLMRVAAIASLLSAITTATLIYGPGAPPADGLEQQARLAGDWRYLYKPWVLFFHPQFAFIACLGLAAALWRKRPALVAIGLFYAAIWAITEMTQQAYIIDALNQYWRPAFLAASEEGVRQSYETLLTGFAAISDSQYFVLLFAFGCAMTCLGAAMWAADALGKAIGIAMFAIGLLSLAAFAGYYFAPAAGATSVTGWIYTNLYGPVQTGVRVALAWWLWREAYRAPGQRSGGMIS